MTSIEETVERIATLAGRKGLRVATAESLTCGNLAARLGTGPQASEWFAGGVVAYQEPVKFDVLGVDEGPVVTARCAVQMAQGVRDLLGVDVVVSATGVGGPDPSEGKPAGTVHVGVASGEDTDTRELNLESDDPDEVLRGTVEAALAMLESVLAEE